MRIRKHAGSACHSIHAYEIVLPDAGSFERRAMRRWASTTAKLSLIAVASGSEHRGRARSSPPLQSPWLLATSRRRSFGTPCRPHPVQRCSRRNRPLTYTPAGRAGRHPEAPSARPNRTTAPPPPLRPPHLPSCQPRAEPREREPISDFAFHAGGKIGTSENHCSQFGRITSSSLRHQVASASSIAVSREASVRRQ